MEITKFIVSHRDNALLVGDYKSYQHQLSRQLASLRKKLGRGTPKNGKYSKRPEVTSEDIEKNHEFIHLLLLSAERAYAHAMSMKASGTEDGTGLPSATRQHIANRLHKAAKHAHLLSSLLSESATTTKATTNDILEARAYAYTLSGAEELEKHAASSRSSNVEAQRAKWGDCLENYAAARVIYIALLRATRDDVFKEYVASSIDPSIRFAAYQSHIPRTVPPITVSRRCFPQDQSELVATVESLDPAAFDDKKATGGGGAGNIPNTITWRSRTANILDASIGQALAMVDTETAQLREQIAKGIDRDSSTAYDPVLIAAQDAVDATRHAIEDHEKEKISEADQRMQDLRVTNLAVNYDLIGWRVGRNRLLIGADDGLQVSNTSATERRTRQRGGTAESTRAEGQGRKLARLRDRTALFDAILQSLDGVKEVPGAMRDSSFVEELEGKRAYFQALKCINIAYSHTLTSPPLHHNALALLVRAESFASTASKILAPTAPDSESSPLRLDIGSRRLQNLQNHVQSSLLHTRALIELHNHAKNSAIAASKNLASAAPAVETLHEYPSSGTVDLKNLRVVAWPPTLKPVPVKPLFFDTAWNYVEYPGKQAAPTVADNAKVDAANGVGDDEPAKPAQKRGWFGFGGGR